jgi:hypothetical protein
MPVRASRWGRQRNLKRAGHVEDIGLGLGIGLKRDLFQKSVPRLINRSWRASGPE